MLQPQRSVAVCSFIFLTSFGTVIAGNEKEWIQLLSYSDISNCKDVSLYINGDKDHILIATWKLDICTTEEVFLNPEYRGKINVDRLGNIWILKVNGSEAAKYYIKCDKLKVELNVSRVLTEQDQMQKCQHDAMCLKNCLAINYSTTMLTDQKGITEESSYHTTKTLDRKISTEGTCLSYPVMLVILVIVVFIALGIVGAVGGGIFIYYKYASRQHKKKTENIQREETETLLEKSKSQKDQLVSDVDKPTLSLKWRFSGRIQGNKSNPWLLDLVLNPDHDLIVTDGQNNQLKKFSLQGKLKSKLDFKTRPDCLALTDGYLVTVTFPRETVLRVINTKDDLSVVSTIPFRLQCTGINSMKDGRLIIGNRESKSVFLCSSDGKILEEIKTGSSGETLFRKPSYIRVVDNRTIYVSDYRTEEFFIININDDNTFAINKHKINYPRTSCVVDGMLLVAASNIRLFKLDGNEAGELLLDGVHHVRGLAFSEDKRLLAITHKSDAEEEISVYEVMKHEL